MRPRPHAFSLESAWELVRMSAVPGSPADYDIAVALPRNGVTPPGLAAQRTLAWIAAFDWLTRLLRAARVQHAGGNPRFAGRSARARRSRSSASASLPAATGIRSRSSSARWCPIYGTLVTSAIALADRRSGELRHRALPHRAVAAPGCAARSAPRSSCWPAIPSIIYGMWGLFVFAPLFADARAAGLHRRPSAHVPVLGGAVRGAADRHRHAHRRADPGGHGDSVHRRGDARRVRARAADAEGIGLWPGLHHAGKWCGSVVLPYTKIGVVGGVMLGLGRALGETMAVTFVIGNAHRLSAVAVRAGQQHRLDARQRVRRGGRRPALRRR